MQYYKYVDEVVGSQSDWTGKKLQVHGYVVPGSIGKKRDKLEYRFDIQRNGKTLAAYYTGIVPDTFKDESEVVLTGVLTKEGFMANDMTAKCPSKLRGSSRSGRKVGLCPLWVTTSCSPRSSSAPMRRRCQWPGARRRSRR